MRHFLLAAAPLLFLPLVALAGPTYTDPAKADEDFAYQGEYVGEVETGEGTKKVGVQVIAKGKGKFHAVGYVGGLPGDGWDKSEKKESDGELKAGKIEFVKDDGKGVLEKGVLTIYHGENKIAELKKVERKSPTLGARPPEGAIVLFDGKNADAFPGAKMDGDLLVQGANSKQKFQDQTLHVEFRLPYQPEDRDQGRGNSGVYLQGRYEVQVLDSFGLAGKNNECGGIYTIKDPDVNMCLPPLAWQTYDIDFTAAKYDAEGKVVSQPKMTVRHNGVVVHEGVELPKSTTAAPNGPGKEPGILHIQDHGNPVRYRNIWVVEKK